MFGAPYTGYLSLLFLVGVLIMVFIDSPLTMLVTAIASILMVAGWYACRTRIRRTRLEIETSGHISARIPVLQSISVPPLRATTFPAVETG